MFKFLKNKLKEAISKITKNVEESVEEVKDEKKISEEIKIKEEEKKEEKKESLKKAEEKKEDKGFLKRFKEKITTKKISSEKFDELFWDLELALLENNVAVEVIDKIKEDLKIDIVDRPIKKKEISKLISDGLKGSVEDLFNVDKINLIKLAKDKKEKPFVILFIGVNGSGKTTTIAKLTKLLIDNKLKCVLVAADTWRKAAIEQLEEHGKRLNVKVIKHTYGADPAAVAFDGIKHGKAKNLDVVLIDTAGRQHSNVNLISEMEKIVRVTKPDFKIFVGESIAGNDCVNQAREFNKAIGIDAIILTKSDVDEKGGAAISISYVIGKPILFNGVGQGYNDLVEFNSKKIIEEIGF